MYLICVNEFRHNCLSSYINTVLKNCSFIHPVKHYETNELEGVSNLTLQVSNALDNELPNIFPTVDNIISSEDVCDKVRSEFRLYQTEIILEDAYLNKKIVSLIQTRRKVLYWETAFAKT